MRRLRQPGPAPAERIDSLAGAGVVLDYTLEPGRDLIAALTAPLIAAGLSCAAISFEGAALAPFRYVLPGPPRDPAHVAWFSDPHTPGGDPSRPSLVERANATFGWRDGAPFVHCHGVWTEPDGARRGGHMLPEQTVLAAPARARAWGMASVAIAVDPDPETNFPLFHPVAASSATPLADAPVRLVAARIRPNEDIGAALVALCVRHGLAAARVRGSLGSLIGAAFADGRAVPDPATEVLVRDGLIAPGPDGALAATLDLVVVDAAGRPHAGRLAPGENPVCITFEAMLEGL
jgi:predicted DNA-binding protein with PD1-like motif